MISISPLRFDTSTAKITAMCDSCRLAYGLAEVSNGRVVGHIEWVSDTPENRDALTDWYERHLRVYHRG